MSLRGLFEFLVKNEEYLEREKGLLERFRRKMSHNLVSGRVDEKEIEDVYKIVLKSMEINKNELKSTVAFKELLKLGLLYPISSPQFFSGKSGLSDFWLELIYKGDKEVHADIVRYVLSQDSVLSKE